MGIRGRFIPVPNLDDRDWRMIKDAMIRNIPEEVLILDRIIHR